MSKMIQQLLIQNLMFNLQITLSDFRCRKRQFELLQQFLVVLRFGTIKLDIKITLNTNQFIGGKKIVLDISSEELRNLFQNFALGMFIENRSGKFFCILSLEKLQFSDIVSGQQVYFYNDQQEIIYSACFSIIFTDFKNPRMPNKQVIQNHKTFNEFYKKPAVPSHTIAPKTLSSFLYGKQIQQQQKQKQKLVVKNKTKQVNGKGKKSNPSITKQQLTKKSNIDSQFLATQTHQNIYIHRPFEEDEYVGDNNPPVMEFTNTAVDLSRGLNLLKTQMAELNDLAPENMKFMTAYDSKNAFLKTKQNDARNTIIKIQEKLQASQNITLGQTKFYKEKTNAVKVDREDLKNKAKKELQNYQGNSNIKIPVFKDGKYELVELAHLNQDQIAKFAQKQKQLEFQQQMKKQMEKQIQKKSKQNSLLKRQLQQKQKLLVRQEEEAKKHQVQLMRAKNTAEQNKRMAIHNKVTNSQIQDSNISDEEQNPQSDKQDSDEANEDQQGNYESDFESMSIASAQKKSRISALSQKKQDQSESYNDSYDPDFQSYSQSLLGSHQKLSMSQISQSLRSNSPKKR